MDIKRVQGSKDVSLLECVNPRRNKWRIRWDVKTDADGVTTYAECEFSRKPTVEDVRQLITSWSNQQTDQAILSGFSYNGALVWLSAENQLNYKMAYDLAVQTNGVTLPVTFKLGSEDVPVYQQFTSLSELDAFYRAVVAHIQNALQEGWNFKDGFDFSPYDI